MATTYVARLNIETVANGKTMRADFKLNEAAVKKFSKTTQTGMEKALGAFGVRAIAFGIAADAMRRAIMSVGGALTDLTQRGLKFNDVFNSATAVQIGLSDRMRSRLQATIQTTAGKVLAEQDVLASAVFSLASSGMSASSQKRALPFFAQFAQAARAPGENVNPEQNIKGLIAAVASLGLQSKNAAENIQGIQRVGDALVTANINSLTTVTQATDAITNKAGLAMTKAGFSLEEAIALVMVFAEQGKVGAEAGTLMNQMVRELQIKSIKNFQAWRNAGIEVFDEQTGKARSLLAIMREMDKFLGSNPEMQMRRLINELGFTMKGLAAIRFGLDPDQFEKFLNIQNAASGSTGKVSGNQMREFAAASNTLTTAWNDFGIAITANEGLLVGVFNNLAGAITVLTDTVKAFTPTPSNKQFLAGVHANEIYDFTEKERIRGYESGRLAATKERDATSKVRAGSLALKLANPFGLMSFLGSKLPYLRAVPTLDSYLAGRIRRSKQEIMFENVALDANQSAMEARRELASDGSKIKQLQLELDGQTANRLEKASISQAAFLARDAKTLPTLLAGSTGNLEDQMYQVQRDQRQTLIDILNELRRDEGRDRPGGLNPNTGIHTPDLTIDTTISTDLN